MNQGMFGWIFTPPGMQDEPCALCGNPKTDCSCPGCGHPIFIDGKEERCRVRGCIEHLLNRDLVARVECLEKQLAELRNEASRRETTTTPCPGCGEVQVVTIFNNGPYCCHGFFYAGEKHGWIKKGEC